MKIKHLLNESNDALFEKIIDTKFFKDNYEEKVRYAVQNDIEFRYIDIAWLHHASSKLKDDGGVITLKMREAPRDTNEYFHSIVNTVSEKELGVPVRNLIFAFTKKHKTSDYGFNDYVLFPLDDDYHLYYSDMIEDMTTHYNVSIFSEKRLKKYIEMFFEKYDIRDVTIKGRIDDHSIRFNNISNDQELHEFSKTLFSEDSEKYSKDELSKLFTEFVTHNLYKKAEHYIGRMVDTQALSKRDEEYLINSKKIAYLKSGLFSSFLTYLERKYM